MASHSTVLRPSFDAYRHYLNRFDGRRGAIVAWIPLALVVITFATTIAEGHSLWWPITLTAAFAVAGIYLRLYFLLTLVTVSPRQLETRNAFGHVRVLEAPELARTVVMPTYTIPQRFTSITLSRTIVLDSRGKIALSMLSSEWSRSQMSSLADALDLPTDHITGGMDAGRLRRRFPHAVPLWIAHYFLTALIISGAIVVLAGAAIAIDIAVNYS